MLPISSEIQRKWLYHIIFCLSSVFVLYHRKMFEMSKWAKIRVIRLHKSNKQGKKTDFQHIVWILHLENTHLSQEFLTLSTEFSTFFKAAARSAQLYGKSVGVKKRRKIGINLGFEFVWFIGFQVLKSLNFLTYSKITKITKG